MATSGTIKGSCTGGNGGKYDFWASWKRNSYSIDNGTSNITVELKVQRNDGYSDSGFNLAAKPSVSLKVNGASKSPTIYHIDTRKGVVCTFATWTGNVTHNDDGSLTCPIVASFSLSGVSSLTGGSLSGNAKLDDIPRASTVSVSGTFRMGDNITITIARKSTSFTHDLTYTFGNAAGPIKNGVATSHPWTIPDLTSYCNNATKGTMVITCTTKNGTKTVGTSTATIEVSVPMPTIPMVSVATINLGEKLDIDVTRNVEAYTHDLTYSLTPEGSTSVVATGTIATSLNDKIPWEVPWELAKTMPAARRGNLRITCTTRFKNSSSSVGGTRGIVVDVIVPENDITKPKISSVDLTCVTELKEKFADIYVAGKTKVKVKTTATYEHSDIGSISVSIAGKTYSGEEITSDYLLSPGKNDIIVTVKDARGYTREHPTSIQVIEYDPPKIIPVSGQSGIVCKRCTSNGAPFLSGEYLLIKAQRSYSRVISGTQKNFCRLKYRYKASLSESFTAWETLVDSNTTTDTFSGKVDDVVLSTKNSYVVEICAEDDIEKTPSVLSFKVSTAFVTLHLGEGGRRVAIGKMAEEDDLFDVGLDTRFDGNVRGRVLGLGKLPAIASGDNINTYVEPGVYAIKTSASAEGILNLPTPFAGILRVWSANGTGNTAGNWVYIVQEYIPISARSIYRRALQTDGSGTWEFGVWYRFPGTEVT